MLETLILASLVAASKNPTTELLEPKIETVQVEPTKIEPKLYVIKSGDNLTKIANAHSVDLSRLWSANPELPHPDVIEPDKPLKIPENDEILADRPMPVRAEVQAPNLVQSAPRRIAPVSASGAKPKPSHRTGKQTPGWYYAGQCTRWVATKRYVPDGWGNASNWKNAATQAGWTVSRVPVDGAIGWTSGHVVYVESVNGNSVTISEQNYDWKGSVRTVTVPASKYTYLY